jgi:hypothetical protein
MKIAFQLACLTLLIGSFPQLSHANVCVYRPPKVRQVHGNIVDQSNRPIPGVVITLIQNGKTVAVETTDDVGLFGFDSIQDGEYQLDASATGFVPARYIVILRGHTRHWNRSLSIKLAVGAELGQCEGSIEVLKRASNSGR